ncbi:hypothetical protein [Tengunoibacter tsumagoiensis]|uniref:HNH nuclease domain-containing protein n=1 Tax=Tengunoibacter tsumagoiensis TaxID=2014871 RepID=A0A402A663_9CHLR|nr:hypothetical protein [Tengunoibacter tsumagoiensis]GCE14505.1 hypothetical protein KTT_43640 [Tengunoibacter tsumagoiensis]
MRYINQQSITLPPDWSMKATRALNKARDLSCSERKDFIKRSNSIWKELKDELLACSHGKCWYCESSISATSSGDIDHFRPKNEVEEAPDHGGYWWLAFDWRNFRYSCEHCNRINIDSSTKVKGGKTSHFPLCDEQTRCCTESSLDEEEPMLLDPTVSRDPLLLTFDMMGMACPARSPEQNVKEYQRARCSIEIYHFNRVHLKNRRKFQICDRIQQLIVAGDELYQYYAIEPTQATYKSFQRICETLLEMIDPVAEYSSAARAILYMYSDDEHQWIQDILEMDETLHCSSSASE